MEEVLDFEEDKKPKKKKKIWLVMLIIITLFMITIFSYYNYLLSPITKDKKTVEFKIENGSSVYSVGERLAKEKIIRNYFAYKVYVKLNGVNEYKAGIYMIDKSLSVREIVDLLSGNKYKNEEIKLTFKEGINIRKIASIITENTDISKDAFYELMANEDYINELIEKYWFLNDDIKNKDIYYPLEGYLYPETYYFNKDISLKDIITKMLDQTDKILSDYKDDINSSKYSIHELVTLASIVEKEGIYDDDRNKIAGVFYNRLNSGMALGSDVTTYYAFKVDMGTRDLTYKELNTYNPYNTRGPDMAGKLPVGPISNFSIISFKAVLNPDINDYYYFVADKNGNTHFTKTYSEHQKVINELKNSGNWLEF